MHNTVTARIDLNALRINLGIVRSLCPQSSVMAMVKADAYGHGLLPVASALDAADGFAVARLKEALDLRGAGVRKRVLVLSTLLDQRDLQICSELEIDVTGHDASSVKLITDHAHRWPLRVWLKLDSGMHRFGLSPDEFVRADRTLSVHRGVVELIHMTHLSSADDTSYSTTERQLSRFYGCRRASVNAKASVANSAALLRNSKTGADWVRPGILLYGVNPLGQYHEVQLRTVMTLRARIVALRDVPMGDSVGYSGRGRCTRTSRIGTVGIGYGDGYPRHAQAGTPVWIKGHHVPLIGLVSMDSLTVDLTDFGGVEIGDEVELWGAKLPAAVVAKSANTVAYELFTSITQRVSREYVDLAVGRDPIA